MGRDHHDCTGIVDGGYGRSGVVLYFLQVDGVLDADVLRDAVSKGKVNVRRADTEAPIMQVALISGSFLS